MSGPCLCGDVYCPSCGNPGAAAYDDFMTEAHERFEECLEEAETPADAFDKFMNDNLEWIAESWNKAAGR